LLPKRFKLFGFPAFRLWAYLMKVIPDTRRTWWRLFQTRTWWRLFQTHVVPDEGYSRHASCALNVISTFLFQRDSITFIVILFITPTVSRCHMSLSFCISHPRWADVICHCNSVYHTHGEYRPPLVWGSSTVLITLIDKMIKSYHDIYKDLFTMAMQFALMFCGLKAHFVLISIIKNSLYKNNGTRSIFPLW